MSTVVQCMEHAPAEPVKNTFFPSSTTSWSTLVCSSLSSATEVVLSVPQVVLSETRGVKKELIFGCLDGLDFLKSSMSVLSPDLRFLILLETCLSDCFAVIVDVMGGAEQVATT